MLSPKRTKFQKQMKGRMKGSAKGGNFVAFGDFGLQALEPGFITSRQIEAARVAITRAVRKSGKVYIRMFPDKPITKNQRKPEWVKVKAAKKATWLSSSLEE